MDFRKRQSVSGHMDEPEQIDAETARLINELLTRVGMLMEDASTPALLSDACNGSLAERVRVLDVAVGRLKTILDATKALMDD